MVDLKPKIRSSLLAQIKHTCKRLLTLRLSVLILTDIVLFILWRDYNRCNINQ